MQNAAMYWEAAAKMVPKEENKVVKLLLVKGVALR